MPSIGPSLPPHLQKARSATSTSDEPQPIAGPSSRRSPPPTKTTVGPSLPPHLQAARQRRSPSPTTPSYDDSSDDDIVGPSIHLATHPADQADGVREFLEREERLKREKEVRAIRQIATVANPPLIGKIPPKTTRTRSMDAQTTRGEHHRIRQVPTPPSSKPI